MFRSELDEIFAANLKNLRKRRGWTQLQLSERLGYEFKSRISEFERGRNSITLEMLHAICEKLKLRPEQMITEGFYSED